MIRELSSEECAGWGLISKLSFLRKMQHLQFTSTCSHRRQKVSAKVHPLLPVAAYDKHCLMLFKCEKQAGSRLHWMLCCCCWSIFTVSHPPPGDLASLRRWVLQAVSSGRNCSLAEWGGWRQPGSASMAIPQDAVKCLLVSYL